MTRIAERSDLANGSLRLPIRTARLILRDLEPDDFDAVHAYGSDPDATRYMFYGPRTKVESRDYLDRMIASQRERPRMVWELGVLRAGDHRLIGTCDLTLEKPEEGDLGFIFSRDAWGLGYATEAARAMVRAGFEQLGLTRIVATCNVSNSASAHVLEKAGLHREATLEDHRFAKGVWWTSFLYGIRRDHWLG
jgi:RimJ/RimL family protein N-acetyltransferase